MWKLYGFAAALLLYGCYLVAFKVLRIDSYLGLPLPQRLDLTLCLAVAAV